MSGSVTIKDDKFLMPDSNVEVKAIFEKDAPPAPTEFTITFDGNDGTPSVGSMTTTNQKLTSLPSASRSGSYSFDGWYTEKSGGTKITTDNLRGFVLDNTSGFEVRIREVLNICWQKFNTEQRKCLSDALVALLDGKKSHVKKQVEQAKDQECPFAYANNDEYALGIADRLDILQIVLPILTTAYHMPAATIPSNFKQYYIDQVNMYRNRLGHITLGEKTIRIKGKDVEINQELHRLLRKNIADVDATIQKLEEYLTKNM